MTERRAFSEGPIGRSRRYTAPTDSPQDQAESTASSNAPDSSAYISRRRSLKAVPSPGDPEHTAWSDVERSERRQSLGGRKPLRRSSGGASTRTSTSPKRGADLEAHEKDTSGYLPTLGRILEGKENNLHRRRRGFTTSSTDPSPSLRRRHRITEPASLASRASRTKHGSLQRRVESLANLPNPSLVSVLSGLTNSSNTSSGSNSTVTQKSYDKTHVSKRRRLKEKKSVENKRAPVKRRPPIAVGEPKTGSTYYPEYSRPPETHPSAVKSESLDSSSLSEGVFQYMQAAMASEQFHVEGIERKMSVSSSGSSSSASSGDCGGAGVGSTKFEAPILEAVTVSPIAGDQTRYRDRVNSDSGISIQDSGSEVNPRDSINYQPSAEQVNDEEGEDEDSGDEESRDVGDEDHHCHPHALKRVAPPRIPPASSLHNDRHYQRLRSQEHELRQHILRNPQPHRDFHFVGGPSPHPQAPLPIFDPYAPTGALPANAHAPAPHANPWPPPAPPPPTIGYYSPPQVPPTLYGQGAESNYTMTERPASGIVVPAPPFHHPIVQPPHYQPHPTDPDLTKTTMVGYELLADKLSEYPEDLSSKVGKILPMYRRFEKLNHRVLLHLQDEISELEEELRYLDESIAQIFPVNEGGHTQPASRRAEARYGGELHYRRTELLGRIYVKLGQYNQALSSFSTMVRTLEGADAEDVQAYHAWMEKHSPVEKKEARFLDHKRDLLSVRRRSSSNISGVGPVQSAAIGLPLILVLPLLAFAMIPGLLGRVFIIFLIGGVAVMLVVSTELIGLMTIREWVACASV